MSFYNKTSFLYCNSIIKKKEFLFLIFFFFKKKSIENGILY